MTNDPELDQIREAVSCPLLLERKGYKLDVRESSRNNPKYRRGAGEIVIVNHDGKGWWDPGSTAKGDVFSLAQHLDGSLNFGQVRRDLRQLVGLTPSFPQAEPRSRNRDEPVVPPALRWASRPKMTEGSKGWNYLVQQRGLPPAIVAAVARADNLREGPYGSAWFAHRDGAGDLTGIEMRGPDYRGFSAGGDKTLFRLQLGTEDPTRLAVLEAPIKAMAFAAIEGHRTDTLYIGTAGGMGPATLQCLQQELTALSTRAGGMVIAASDADEAGERYAVRISGLATEAGVPSVRAAPVGWKDWDDVLKASAGSGQLPRAASQRSSALADVLATLRSTEMAGPAPWTPKPLSMGQRIATVEQRSAMMLAERLADRNGRSEPRIEQPRTSLDMGPSS